mmetsp:Transcript_1375/g.1863  ORF Transcript_1375/g.1863 Transcript_1375/m.1863 type:complete len:234 (+) Transcript_1375:128-829(+)
MDNPSNKEPRKLSALDVVFFYPNLVGYARIAFILTSYALALSNWKLAVLFYWTGFFGDIIDGWVARKFNQCSQFGAILDMVTDRASTAGLLATLSALYPDYYFCFVILIFLDISSHWLQVNSAQKEGRHHKSVAGRNFVLRAYYEIYFFFGFCCVGTEVFYLALYVLYFCPNCNFISIPPLGIAWPLAQANVMLGVPACLIKQFVNVCQLASAVMAICGDDAERINNEAKKDK